MPGDVPDYSDNLSQFLANAGRDKKAARRLAQELVSSHTLNREGRSPLDSLSPQMRDLVVKEIQGLNPAFLKKFKGKGGVFDFRDKDTGARMQKVAGRVDHLVSGAIRYNLPEEKAKRTLAGIIDEIMKRNNW